METTADYKCSQCGASGVKLWRKAQLEELRCVSCAADEQGVLGRLIGDDGLMPENPDLLHSHGTKWIGNRLPALPAGDTFWGYSSAPLAAWEWWKALPTRVEPDTVESLRKQLADVIEERDAHIAAADKAERGYNQAYVDGYDAGRAAERAHYCTQRDYMDAQKAKRVPEVLEVATHKEGPGLGAVGARWDREHGEKQGHYAFFAGFEADSQNHSERLGTLFDDFDIYDRIELFAFVSGLLDEQDGQPEPEPETAKPLCECWMDLSKPVCPGCLIDTEEPTNG